MESRVKQRRPAVGLAGLAGALLVAVSCLGGGGGTSASAGAAQGDDGDDGLEQESAEIAASGGCIRTGCSGQLCADRPRMTTCEWQPAYACYQSHGICERDARGICGFRPTPQLLECLRNAR